MKFKILSKFGPFLGNFLPKIELFFVNFFVNFSGHILKLPLSFKLSISWIMREKLKKPISSPEKHLIAQNGRILNLFWVHHNDNDEILFSDPICDETLWCKRIFANNSSFSSWKQGKIVAKRLSEET